MPKWYALDQKTQTSSTTQSRVNDKEEEKTFQTILPAWKSWIVLPVSLYAARCSLALSSANTPQKAPNQCM